MDLELPAPVATYVAGTNAHDDATFLAAFAPDAVVHDDGDEHRGLAEITRWFAGTAAYRLTMVPTAWDGTVLTSTVTGTFDGSPLEFHHAFTLDGDHIAELRIGV